MASSFSLAGGHIPRRISEVVESGTADGGNDVRLNVSFEDGTTEYFDIAHHKVGQFVTSLEFGAEVAKRHRDQLTPGYTPTELSAVMDIIELNANSFPGADFIVLRMTTAPGVNLDFKIPLHSLPEMAQIIRLAQQIAGSGATTSRH